MTPDSTSATNTDREKASLEMDIENAHHNARKRREEQCSMCGEAVPEQDFSAKFAGAGGVLAGPFCSRDCYWRFMDG